MKKEQKPINTPVEGVSHIRFKIWFPRRKGYLGCSTQNYEWWTAERAEKFARDKEFKHYEIHQTETITLTKPVRVVKKK